MMARSIFIIASTIIALAVDKLSNAFTIIIHQKIKQTQLLLQSRQSCSPRRDADQSFQFNLNLKDDESSSSPFWFITFEEENDSSLKEDESSDFQSPFWFATFEEDDDSPLQSEDESFSFTPPQQHEQPDYYSSDVNHRTTTARKNNNGFIFRDFALAATSNLLVANWLVVVAHNKNTTATEAVVESVWTISKGAALYLVAATSILVKTIEAAEKLHLKSSAKLAVALAIAGGDIFVKGGGCILRDVVADGVTKKPLGEKIAGVEIETRPRTGTDAVLSESSEALQADEQIIMIEGERDQVQSILELPKDDVRATTTSSAKNQSDEELIGLDDQSVEDSTTGLPKLEDGIAETFIVDTERETVNNPPDVASVFDLELPKPVEDDVIDMSTSSAIEESEDALIERDDQSVVENTAGLPKLEDNIAEPFICNAQTDVASAFDVELPKPVMDEVLEMSTSSVIEESEEELIERDDQSEMLIERHDRPARDNINKFPKVEDRSLLEQRLTYEKDQDELIITTATAATWSEPAKAENDSLDNPVSYPFHRANLERRLAYSKEETARTAERKAVAERKLLLEKRLTYEQEEKAKNVEREAVAVRRSLLERRLDGAVETFISDAETKTVNNTSNVTSAFLVSEKVLEKNKQRPTDEHSRVVVDETSDRMERETKMAEFSFVSDAAEKKEQSSHGYLISHDKEESDAIVSTTTKVSAGAVAMEDKLASDALTWNDVERKEANDNDLDGEFNEFMIDRPSSMNGALKQDHDRSDSQLASNLLKRAANNYQSGGRTVTKEISDINDVFAGGDDGDYGREFNNHSDKENLHAHAGNARLEADELPLFHELYFSYQLRNRILLTHLLLK